MKCQWARCNATVTPETPRCWWHERKARDKRRARSQRRLRRIRWEGT